MSKIRINELARELEVKPNVILDLLPELGVGDKKTHSSSLDDDVALAIRRKLFGKEEHIPRRTERPAPELVEETGPSEHSEPPPVRVQPEVLAPPPPAPEP